MASIVSYLHPSRYISCNKRILPKNSFVCYRISNQFHLPSSNMSTNFMRWGVSPFIRVHHDVCKKRNSTRYGIIAKQLSPTREGYGSMRDLLCGLRQQLNRSPLWWVSHFNQYIYIYMFFMVRLCDERKDL